MPSVRFIRTPIVVEAIRWDAGPFGNDGRRDGGNESEINRFVHAYHFCWSSDGHPCIPTPLGLERLEPGDWIVREAPNEYRRFTAEAFAANFMAPPTERPKSYDFGDVTETAIELTK